MVAESPFVVHVGDLLGDQGQMRSHSVSAPVEWSVGESHIDGAVEADLVLSSASGGIVVRGTVTAPVTATCGRCLDEFTEDIRVELAQLVEDGDVAGDGDSYALDRDTVDLEPMLRDEVLLAVPTLPRCPEGCAGPAAGLVTDTESGLNTAGPGDGRRESPFAVLEDLFDTGD